MNDRIFASCSCLKPNQPFVPRLLPELRVATQSSGVSLQYEGRRGGLRVS